MTIEKISATEVLPAVEEEVSYYISDATDGRDGTLSPQCNFHHRN